MIKCNFLRCAALLAAVFAGMCGNPLRAQGQLIALPRPPITVEEAISLVESQSGLIIGVNHAGFDVARLIVPKSESMSVDDILKLIVAGTDHIYIRKDRHVMIVAESKPAKQSQPAVGKPVAETPAVPEIPQPEPVEPVPLPPAVIPETIRYKTIYYRDAGQTLSFSATGSGNLIPVKGKQPAVAVKTNAAWGLATLTPNIGVEFGAGRRMTVEVSGGWNPWKLKGGGEGNSKFVHLFIQPELRWWMCERFNGHFAGVHLVAAAFNISQRRFPAFGFDRAYRYQGYAVGAGLSYGYALMLSPSVNLEFTAGLGVWRLKYDRYDCAVCARDYLPVENLRFGPTKAGISLSFIIK